MIIPVVLAGGLGKRLWPLSREQHPKQLISLYNEKSLLQNTILRAQLFPDCGAPIIVGNFQRRFIIKLQLNEIGIHDANILLEPEGRGSAAAIALASLHALKQHTDPVLLIMPIDHYIKDTSSLTESLSLAKAAADANKLVVFGVSPTTPDTNYGYIQAGDITVTKAYHVKRFVEKPGEVTAQTFIDEDNYYWNSGMFMFKASQIIREIEQFSPEIVQAARAALEQQNNSDGWVEIDKFHFSQSPNISIDYAVMEKTTNAVMVPLTTSFTDIGNWQALHNASYKDEHENTVVGDVIAVDTKNCYLRSNRRLIATIGLKDHIVVETADVVFIAHKDCAKEVNKMVDILQDRQRPEAVRPQIIHRPWGNYQVIDVGKQFQVKEITVIPGAALSLQMHRQRSEHWVVLKGKAKIQIGEDVMHLTTNQSVYIPAGVKHRLENIGVENVEIVEVQIGSYLGEDDIVRFDDVYHRQSHEV